MMKFPLSGRSLLVWVLSLAFLSVGARNFEPGLSVDGPLYCTIARHIVRTGEWFALYAGVPDFVPFAEHPHLHFWMLALWFKIFPMEDWSARIPGHLFYVAFLVILFLFIRQRSNERVAVGTVIILWAWDRFSGFFSSVYLDPGTLFLGSFFLFSWDSSLRRGSIGQAALAGFSAALCALFKGVALFGFLPAAVGITLWNFSQQAPRQRKRLFALPFVALGMAAVILGAYLFALSHSQVPNFLQIYWQRQITRRLAVIWSWSALWGENFWWTLFKDTYYLLPVSLLVFFQHPKKLCDEYLIPILCAITFIFLYAPVNLVRAQYWITLLPWLAWLIAGGVSNLWEWNERGAVRLSMAISLAALCFVQYLPFRTHPLQPPAEAANIRGYVNRHEAKHLYVDIHPTIADFSRVAGYAWYGDINVDYANASIRVPAVESGQLYLLLDDILVKRMALAAAQWCLREDFTRSSLWNRCPDSTVGPSQASGENGKQPLPASR